MCSYMYSSNVDKDIENIVKSCKGCALASKPPPIEYSLWPNRPWSRIPIDFAGPLDGFYYLTVVDRFSKWPEVLSCRNPTTEVTIIFLHELFARFEVVDCLVSDNGTQSGDFKDFCETFQINYIMIASYYTKSSGLAERFVDTLKRAPKKARGTPTEKSPATVPSSLPPAKSGLYLTSYYSNKLKSVEQTLSPKTGNGYNSEKSSNLLSVLPRCGTRPYEWGTQ